MIVDGLNQLFITLYSSFSLIFSDAPQVAFNVSDFFALLDDSSVLLGLRYLAWFIPLNMFAAVVASWLACCLVFSIVLFIWNNYKELRR